MRTIKERIQLSDGLALVVETASGQTFYVYATTQDKKSPEVVVSEFDGELTFEMQGCDLDTKTTL